jgi:hypothetical protein
VHLSATACVGGFHDRIADLLVIYLIVIGVVIWLLTLPPRTDIASSAGMVYPSSTRANKRQAAQPAAALMSALGHLQTLPTVKLMSA